MAQTLEENVAQQVGEHRFVLNRRYSDPQPLKDGPWGFMVKAVVTASQQVVTIHQVKNIFGMKNHDMTQLLHVMQKLRCLKGQQHVLTVFDIYTDPVTSIPADGHIDHPHYSESFLHDLYIVTRFVDRDFNSYLQAPLPLADSDIQYCLFQLLKGAQNLHDTVHLTLGDVNPSCILGQESTNEWMYGSFGIRDPSSTQTMRQMRAPERLYAEGFPPADYRPADVWSIGCLFAALLCHRTSFFEGATEKEILTDMARKLNWVNYDRTTTWEFLKQCHSHAYDDIFVILQEEATTQDDEYPAPRFASFFPSNVSHDALDLLQQMLRPVPETRITIADALRHPYLQNYHNPFTDFRDIRQLEDQRVSPTDGSFVSTASPKNQPLLHASFLRTHSPEGSNHATSPAHQLLSAQRRKSMSPSSFHVMSVNMLDDESSLTLAQLQQLWYEEIVKYHNLFLQRQPTRKLSASSMSSEVSPHRVHGHSPIAVPVLVPVLTPVPKLETHHLPHIHESLPSIHGADPSVHSGRSHDTHLLHDHTHQPAPPSMPIATDPIHHHVPLATSTHLHQDHRTYHVLSDQEARRLEDAKSLTAVPPESHYHAHDHSHDCHHNHEHSPLPRILTPHYHDHDHDHDVPRLIHVGEGKDDVKHGDSDKLSARHVLSSAKDAVSGNDSDEKYDARHLARMYNVSTTANMATPPLEHVTVTYPDEKKQLLADTERQWVRHHLAEGKDLDDAHSNHSRPHSQHHHLEPLPSLHLSHDHDHLHDSLLDEKKEDDLRWDGLLRK